MEQLRQEIRNLKEQQKQQEAVISNRLSQLRRQFKPFMQTLRFLGKGSSRWGRVKSWLLPGKRQKTIKVHLDEGKSKRGFKEQASDLLLNKGVQYALPFLLNRILFRSKFKAGLVSLLEVALTEGVKSVIKHPKTSFQQARGAMSNARNAIKGAWESRKAKDER